MRELFKYLAENVFIQTNEQGGSGIVKSILEDLSEDSISYFSKEANDGIAYQKSFLNYSYNPKYFNVQEVKVVYEYKLGEGQMLVAIKLDPIYKKGYGENRYESKLDLMLALQNVNRINVEIDMGAFEKMVMSKKEAVENLKAEVIKIKYLDNEGEHMTRGFLRHCTKKENKQAQKTRYGQDKNEHFMLEYFDENHKSTSRPGFIGSYLDGEFLKEQLTRNKNAEEKLNFHGDSLKNYEEVKKRR